MPPATRPPGRWFHGSNAIPGHCCLGGPPPAGRTDFTAAGASMPPGALPGLRPAAAPPGGRARTRSGAGRSCRRISFVAAGLCSAESGLGWQADSADHRPAATSGSGPRGVAGALEPALAASAGRMPKRSWRGVSGGQDGHGECPGDRGPQSLACTNPLVASVRRDGTGSPEPASSRAATSGAVFRLRPIPTGSLTAPRRVLTVRDSPVAASAFPRTWGVPPGGVRFARLRRRILRSAR
jgi:hypothetical protein